MRHAFKYVCALALVAAAAPAADLPRPSPELKVTLTDGRDFQLSTLRGKVVALEFIFTTCPHCQQLCQTTSKLLTEYGPRGFRALAVACNDGADLLAPEFVKQYGVTFPVGIGSVDMMFGYIGAPPKPFRLPQLLFIDRKGTIRGQFTGEDPFFTDETANMRKMIEQLLREPGPGAAAKPRAKSAAR